jgi:hypothetical protein
MSEDKIFLTKEQALKLIGDRDQVHTFRSMSMALIGCDWSRESILETIENAGEKDIEIGGEMCKKMGHGLVIWTSESDPLFIEVDKIEIEELEKQLT